MGYVSEVQLKFSSPEETVDAFKNYVLEMSQAEREKCINRCFEKMYTLYTNINHINVCKVILNHKLLLLLLLITVKKYKYFHAKNIFVILAYVY